VADSRKKGVDGIASLSEPPVPIKPSLGLPVAMVASMPDRRFSSRFMVGVRPRFRPAIMTDAAPVSLWLR